jgi:hypothetical protein
LWLRKQLIANGMLTTIGTRPLNWRLFARWSGGLFLAAAGRGAAGAVDCCCLTACGGTLDDEVRLGLRIAVLGGRETLAMVSKRVADDGAVVVTEAA